MKVCLSEYVEFILAIFRIELLKILFIKCFCVKVLGKNGRGLTEHFKVPISEVDLIVGSLEHSFSSIGGFCVGSHFIVEHQRLSGLGNCCYMKFFVYFVLE